jgi:hypothetical protein
MANELDQMLSAGRQGCDGRTDRRAGPRRRNTSNERLEGENSMTGSHRYSRRLMQTLVVTVVLGFLLAGLTPAARAGNGSGSRSLDQQTTPQAAEAACTFDVGLTIKQGTVIRGSGSFTKCTVYWHITVSLQRERWYGWQPLSTKSLWSTGSVGVSWNCAGTGTYTYRTLVNAYHRDGRRSAYKISNHLRVAC